MLQGWIDRLRAGDERLSSVSIRRELLDLLKRYHGPLGLGARHSTGHDGHGSAGQTSELPKAVDLSHEPSRLAAWSEFHEKVGTLPDEERDVFELIWYQGLSQAESAEVLHVSKRTLQRRWQAARLHLVEALHGDLPPQD